MRNFKNVDQNKLSYGNLLDKLTNPYEINKKRVKAYLFERLEKLLNESIADKLIITFNQFKVELKRNLHGDISYVHYIGTEITQEQIQIIEEFIARHNKKA